MGDACNLAFADGHVSAYKLVNIPLNDLSTNEIRLKPKF
jgi:prepilin-type processing-associated H-X9-DG protein